MLTPKKSKLLIILAIVIVLIIIFVISLFLKDSTTKKWCWSESKSQKSGNINESRYYDCQREHLIFKFTAKKPDDYKPASNNNFMEIYEELQESK